MEKTGSEAPPPSYTESLSAPRPSNALTGAVDTYLLPHVHSAIVNQTASTILVVVPSNVSALSRTAESPSEKEFTPSAFPGETLVGFSVAPTVIRLSGAENSLEFWRRPAVLKELETRLRRTLEGEGYSIVHRTPKPQSNATIAGSRNVDWKSQDLKVLGDSEAKVAAEVEEVCLRIENEMGLYETRSGKAVIIRVELGIREHQDPEWVE